MPRYKHASKFRNNLQFYEFLRQKRGDVSSITQYNTIVMRNPSPAQRAAIATTTHIWKYGDRFYNLAHQQYGSSSYWWVIAWWNARPTEAHCRPGDLIMIPLDIENALIALGSD